MRAVVYTRVGPPEVLEVRDVAKPQPQRAQVLVRVRAASANALDWRRFAPLGKKEHATLAMRLVEGLLLRTVGMVLGADIAGVVESVGERAARFRPGDEVFGVAVHTRGAFAEYACAREEHLALKPNGISFDAAAAVPIAALTALQSMRAHVKPGHKVLVHGSSGGVGTFAVQLARALGAEVTAVTSARGTELAQSLGAVRVIDYSQEDFTARPERFDLIIVVNGERSLRDFSRALAPGGRCVVIGGPVALIAQAAFLGPLLSLVSNKKLGFMGIARANATDLSFLAELLAAGKIAPVVERRYPLHDAATAIRYLAEGHARGKVVLTVDGIEKING